MDTGTVVQSATNLTYNASSFITASFTNTVTLALSKRFRTFGNKAHYTFTVTSNTALNSKAIYYFDFHMRLNPYLDNEGGVECYIRTSSVLNDATAQ